MLARFLLLCEISHMLFYPQCKAFVRHRSIYYLALCQNYRVFFLPNVKSSAGSSHTVEDTSIATNSFSFLTLLRAVVDNSNFDMFCMNMCGRGKQTLLRFMQ